MYRRPELTSALWMTLAMLLLSQGSMAASGGKSERALALGSLYSLRGVGVCAEIGHESGTFGAFSLTADLIDILDGTASTPGVKGNYYYNLLLRESADGKYQFYMGPGLTAGHVRDLHNHIGLMGGLSVDAGFRVHCLHSIMVSAEFQADFALQFKNRYRPDMSLYRAGFWHSYIPFVRIQYCF